MRAFAAHLRQPRARYCSRLVIAGILIFAGSLAWTQSTTTSEAGQKQSSNADGQKPDRVTTTVVVHGEVKDDYLSGAATSASLDDLPVRETPMSVTDVTAALMSDQVSRVLSDV